MIFLFFRISILSFDIFFLFNFSISAFGYLQKKKHAEKPSYYPSCILVVRNPIFKLGTQFLCCGTCKGLKKIQDKHDTAHTKQNDDVVGAFLSTLRKEEPHIPLKKYLHFSSHCNIITKFMIILNLTHISRNYTVYKGANISQILSSL